MRAVWISKHGKPQVLQVRETSDPQPAPGEVRVRTQACGLNFAEVMARQGLYPDAPKPPCIVGYEAAGIIDALGEGVDQLEVGQRVMIIPHFGGHSDTVIAKAELVLPIPDSMSFTDAAAMPVNYVTAYHMLFRVSYLRPGMKVLVHMAAGGVGMACMQLAQTVDNVTVFGTASASKHDRLRQAGCTHPIDYRTKDYAEVINEITDGYGVDLVLDPLGGKDWRKGYDLLAPAGQLIAFGFSNVATGEKRNLFKAGSQMLSVPFYTPLGLMEKNRTVSGVDLEKLFATPKMLADEMREVIRLYEEGIVKPTIDSTFSFDEASAAHQRIHDRKNVGKVLLIP